MTETNHKAVAVIERPGVVETMHPVVKAMMARDIGPDDLDKLLAVQERYEANEARKSYAAALVELKTDLPTVIGKDATVDYTSSKGRTYYKHASLACAMEAITEPLTRHGFSLAWIPGNDQSDEKVRVTCRLTHAAGHYEECTLGAMPDVSGGKREPHAVSSTATLLSRYTALSLLGIATADMKEPDDDAEDDPDHIDGARNMKAARAIIDRGQKREDAEKLVGRPVQEWTAADLDKLRQWLRPKAEPEAKPKPKAEPNQKLKEALGILGCCRSMVELESVSAGIKKLGLKGNDRKIAGDAYKAKLAEITAPKVGDKIPLSSLKAVAPDAPAPLNELAGKVFEPPAKEPPHDPETGEVDSDGQNPLG